MADGAGDPAGAPGPASSVPGDGAPLPARTALVTGGTGGLGRAVVDVFVARGWRTVFTSRRAETLADARPDGRSELVAVDLFDEAQVAEAVAVAAADGAAPLRAVVNLLGGFAAGARVADSSPDEFEALFRLNVRPTYLVTRAALPHLLASGDGAIVSVSSRAAVQPFPGAAAYIASKAAVIAFSNAVAVEYGPQGVRSNVVLPSMIDTPANRASQPEADPSRWTDPQDVAETIHFLAGDASRAVSGAAVPV